MSSTTLGSGRWGKTSTGPPTRMATSSPGTLPSIINALPSRNSRTRPSSLTRMSSIRPSTATPPTAPCPVIGSSTSTRTTTSRPPTTTSRASTASPGSSTSSPATSSSTSGPSRTPSPPRPSTWPPAMRRCGPSTPSADIPDLSTLALNIGQLQFLYKHSSQLLLVVTQRMNVVRDLRNTITHLEAELERKEKQSKKQQQEYEEIIASLQVENEKLKVLLQGDSITHKDEEFFKDESQIRHDSKKEQVPYISTSECLQLINENTFLRNEIVELSATYQKQIDQLVFYFEKIKHENKRISPGHYTGQIKMMASWFNTCVRDFQSERQKYDRKLLECGQTLDLYQAKIKQLGEELQGLRIDLLEKQERLRILSRVQF